MSKVDFFIVGAPKSGSTSLYEYLKESDDIFFPDEKEINYFSSQSIKAQGLYYSGQILVESIDEYSRFFRDSRPDQIKGECSVSYLFYEDVAKKINTYNCNAKIIICLRNPVDRAFSHYLMDLNSGYLSGEFESYLVRENLTEAKDLLAYQQIVELGLYFSQIKRYFDVFGDDNIHIVLLDELKKNPQLVMRRLLKFLDCKQDLSFNSVERKHNEYRVPRLLIVKWLYQSVWARSLVLRFVSSNIRKRLRRILLGRVEKPRMSDESRELLRRFYKDDIGKLESLCGIDLSAWDVR